MDMDAFVRREVATHGVVRMPWVAFPGVHPFEIHWRMGGGEHQLMLIAHAAPEPMARRAQINAAGPIPADWVWWVIEYLDVPIGDREPDPNFGAYDNAFEDVRDVLEGMGFVIVGQPRTDPTE